MKRKLSTHFAALAIALFGVAACSTPEKENKDNIAVTGVSVSPDSYTMTVGDPALKLTATVMPENATNKEVVWESDHPEIAYVEDGVVTAVKDGAVVITVKTVEGGFEAFSNITISDGVIHPTDIDLDKTEETIYVGGATLTLTPSFTPTDTTNKAVRWESSLPTVATVADGVVTAVGEGTTVIKVVSIDGNLEATCTVHVEVPVTGVSFITSPINVAVDEPFRIDHRVVFAPTSATNKKVTFTSEDEAKLTIADPDSDGRVYATALVGAVSVKITVTTDDGDHTADLTVNVADNRVHPASVTLNRESITLMFPDGQPKTLTAEVLPANTDNKAVAWTSSDETVVSVEDGVLTPLKEGTATITVTTVDDIGGAKTDDCAVAVTYLGEVTFLTANTWKPATGNGRTMSDDVLVERCRGKETFASSNNKTVDCRENTKVGGEIVYGDLLSIGMMTTYAAQLCPSPWKIPAESSSGGDFFALDRDLGGTGAASAQANWTPKWLEKMGIRYGGYVQNNGTMKNQGSYSVYGTTSAMSSNVYVFEAVDTGNVSVRKYSGYSATFGYVLRCVKL